jgi:outer membrane protein assembly factor BamC
MRSLRLLIISLTTLISGCGSELGNLLPDRKVEYKKQRIAEKDLEVPPDLTKSTLSDAMPVPGYTDTATYSEYATKRQERKLSSGTTEVLPQVANIQIMRNGDQRWLEIQAPPDKVWHKVLNFWQSNGIPLLEQDPGVGVMKTDWLENRADIPQGFISDLLRKALDNLYSASTRDQFRVRLEPGTNADATDLYLTHRGMEEQFATSTTGEKQNAFWAPRPTDPGLEAEMLRRIMLYLGATEQTAQQSLVKEQTKIPARTQLEQLHDGSSALLVKTELYTAWRLVGIALERAGFAVEDRDSEANLYYVRYDDPDKDEEETGFFSSLAFWRDTETADNSKYHIKLQSNDDVTRVVVLNLKNEPEKSATATRILTLLQEQIR